jgi:hypothetical protein
VALIHGSQDFLEGDLYLKHLEREKKVEECEYKLSIKLTWTACGIYNSHPVLLVKIELLAELCPSSLKS